MKLTLSAILIAVVCLCPVLDAQYHPPVNQSCIDLHKSNFGAWGQAYNSSGYWHCGDDIECEAGTPVSAPVSGCIIGGSPSGWDSPDDDRPGKRKNYALLIRCEISGRSTVVVLGHLRRPVENGLPLPDEQIRTYLVGDEVFPGEAVGNVGHWIYGNHLHVATACSDPLPTSGFGRQPLPLPLEVMDGGVRSLGVWRDPLPWLKRAGATRPATDQYLPLPTADDTGFRFISEGDSQTLASANVSGGNISPIAQLPSGEKAKAMFNGPLGSVFVKTFGNGGFSLWWITLVNQPRRLITSAREFEYGNWNPEADYLPVRINGSWQAVLCASGEIKAPSEVLRDSGRLWQLIGATTDCGKKKSYLARFLVGPDSSSESVLYQASGASLECMNVIPLQSDHSEWPQESKDLVWLRKEMSGCSIWRCLLRTGMNLFGGIPPLDIPFNDERLTKRI